MMLLRYIYLGIYKKYDIFFYFYNLFVYMLGNS